MASESCRCECCERWRRLYMRLGMITIRSAQGELGAAQALRDAMPDDECELADELRVQLVDALGQEEADDLGEDIMGVVTGCAQKGERGRWQ